nr:hypothetical protein [Rickettsia endosymbiont of Ceutorhynchus assimilis]
MTIYHLNSGLEKQFYTIHEINFAEENNCEEAEYNYEQVEYNKELFVEYHSDEEDVNMDSDELEAELEQIFWDGLSYCNKYYEPSIFNEKVAYECDLTPFQWRGKNMLALCSNNMNVTLRLEAYQLLTSNTIDPKSKFFIREGEISKDAEDVIGKVIAERILKII